MAMVVSVPAARECANGAGQGIRSAPVVRPSSPGLAWVWFGGTALLTAAAATQTVVWSRAMSGMGAIPMPGGWTLSMMWLPVCGQSWVDAAAAFLAMWVVMMVAMMMPVVAFELWRSRPIVAPASKAGSMYCLVHLILAMSACFVVWAVQGVLIYLIGVALAALALQQPVLARAAPMSGGAMLLAAGVVQWSAWKARRLACCRRMEGGAFMSSVHVMDTCRRGIRLSLCCTICCANLTAVLLVIGVMDLSGMACVTVAIVLERLLPAGRLTVRITGGTLIIIGVYLTTMAQG